MGGGGVKPMARSRIVIALLVALAACSSHPGEGTPVANPSSSVAVHPVSGLAVVPLTVIHGDRRHAFRVEVARTGAEQAHGLMFRTQMGPDEGMLFPFDPPRDGVAFWMKNTVIPLDILFIGANGRILNIAAMAEPYSLAPIPASGTAAAVLELNGGRAAQLGIGPGDKVEW
jgi:uncharacterized membrane protein (UPF0127 family)